MIPKPGNPHGAAREPLHNVSAKFDEETYQMLRKLEELHGPNIRGRRSAVLRQAIRREHARIQNQK